MGWTPAATRPAKWAISVIRMAPTSSAIARKAAKSQKRGYAVAPVTISFGRCSRASAATSSMSIRWVVAVHVVGHEVVVLAGEVDRRAVGQVAALVEGEAHDGVAALQQGVVDGHVGLRPGVRLHVGVLRAEQLLGAVAGQVLGHVHHLAAAVVAASRVALGVLAR